MALQFLRTIELPEHMGSGGFDHIAYHPGKGWLYAAHTINNALDVIDCHGDGYLHSIPNLTGVAGVLVSPEEDQIFTTNRGENTVGIFRWDAENKIVKVPVGVRPSSTFRARSLPTWVTRR